MAPIFSDTTRIASQRPRNLAELLVDRGNEVTVISARAQPSDPPPPQGVRVLAPVEGSPRGYLKGSETPLLWRLIVSASVITSVPKTFILKSRILSSIFHYTPERRDLEFQKLQRRRFTTANIARAALASTKWSRDTRKALLPILHAEGSYDAIWATYGPYGSLWLAQKLRDAGISEVWVADLRDPLTRPGPLLPVQIFRSFQKSRFLRDATALTVVSEGLRRMTLRGSRNNKYASKVSVLPNGYLRRSEKNLRREPLREGAPLRIVYTGSLYPDRSDLSMLFKAMSALERDVDVELHYAGNAGDNLLALARQAGVDDRVVNHGMLPREDALKLQEEADVLLVLSWNDKDSQGILTGKFAEYLPLRIPIVSLVSGDVAGAELTELIEKMNVGAAFEYARGTEEQSRLTDFLRRVSEERAQSPSPMSRPNDELLREFDYRQIAVRLESLLGSLATK